MFRIIDSEGWVTGVPMTREGYETWEKALDAAFQYAWEDDGTIEEYFDVDTEELLKLEPVIRKNPLRMYEVVTNWGFFIREDAELTEQEKGLFAELEDSLNGR